MKKLIFISFATLISGFLLLPLYVFAEEDTVSGKAGVILRSVDGARESSKFEEYRDIPEGVSGEVDIRYKKKDTYFFEFKAKDIAEDDQKLKLSTGRYGKYRIELIYDQIPHRFAYDAKTLYGGVGSGNLVLGDRMQSDLQGSTSSTDLAGRINSYFAGASSTDLELFRKTGKVNIDLVALDPINFRVEFKREEREGTRPFSGSFGFGNMVEIPEPIDYETTSLKLIAEYSKKQFYLNASYYLSIFENNISTLTWDNPYRVTDSTTATAYSASYAAGSSKGLIDLYPDNRYQNITLSGSLKNLPLKSRLSATASWGWMEQDDELVPYTTNTAIKKGAANSPPFDASNLASLPESKIDAKVDTSLYNILLTSRPLGFMNLKARYRFYEYENKTEEIHFPGYVRADAVWEPIAEENLSSSYKKNTAGIDIAFDLLKATTLTLGYTFEKTEREHREVAESDDNIYSVSVNTTPLSWLDLRLSYEKSQREGDYDYTVPFEGATVTAQLPWLRKYDEANRDRDRVQFLATVNPIEPLTLTGSVIYGKDDFKDSPFGLLEDKHNIYSIDADYAVSKRLNLLAFYSHEEYKNRTKARQWTPSSIGDPYTREKAYESNSNWEAENEDKADTFGGGLNFAVVPKKLDFKISYAYSKTDGTIRLSSPAGTSANDNNPSAPIDFTEVDDIKRQTMHAKLKYYLAKGLSVVLGYMWEKFDVKDFDNTGFTYIPTDASGAYNGALLMGTIPKDYDVSVIYTKLTYSF